MTHPCRALNRTGFRTHAARTDGRTPTGTHGVTR